MADTPAALQLALKFDDPEQPFAGYTGMQNCLAANDGAPDPEGVCAWQFHDTHGTWPRLTHSGAMVALAVFDDLADRLAIPGARPPSELHVTLAFLGDATDLSDEQVALLIDTVGRFAAGSTPLAGNVSGVGRFTAQDPNVVYASVDLPALPEFRQALVAELERVGIPVSHHHGYTPHITLAFVAPDDPTMPIVDAVDVEFGWLLVAVAGERTLIEIGTGFANEEDTVMKDLKDMTTAEKSALADSAEKELEIGSVDWVRAEIRALFKQRYLAANPTVDSDDTYCWVAEMYFDGRAIVELETLGSCRLYEVAYVVNGDAVAIGAPVEVQRAYVPITVTSVPEPALPAPTAPTADAPAPGYTLRDDTSTGPDTAAKAIAELTGPIVAKNDVRQIAYAAVLVPGEPDSDGDTLSAEKIEDVAHTWLADYRNIDLQHTLNNVPVVPVESYLTPTAMKVTIDGADVELPAGSWIMGAQFRDADLWGRVERGELTGFSIMGVPEAAVKTLAAVKFDAAGVPMLDDVAVKRTTLTDIGGGDANGPWVAPFVSLVDRPAVPKAKWFAFKSEEPPARESLFKRALAWLTAAPKAVPDGTDGTCHGATKSSTTPSKEPAVSDTQTTETTDTAEAEAFATAIKDAVTAAVAPIAEKVEAIEQQLAEPPAATKTEGDTGGETESDDDAALKQLETAINDAVDTAVKSITDEFEQKLNEIEARIPRAASKALGGQDGNEPPPAATKSTGRDAFGRVVK